MSDTIPIRDVRDILRDMLSAVERGDMSGYATLFEELDNRHKHAIATLRARNQWEQPHP